MQQPMLQCDTLSSKPYRTVMTHLVCHCMDIQVSTDLLCVIIMKGLIKHVHTWVYSFFPQGSCGGDSLKVHGEWKQLWIEMTQEDQGNLAFGDAGLEVAAASAGPYLR